MNKKIKLSVILPSYLEEENLRLLLPRLTQTLKSMNENYEILVVDTISKMDNTADVCKKNNAIYINRENGNNYGDAIRTGISHARGEYIIFMDADGSHSPEFIHDLYEHHKTNDIVIASRYIKGGSTDNNMILILMSLIVNKMYSIVLGLKCKDVSNSFKLYKSGLLKNLNLYCNNFDIVEEILYKIYKNNKNIHTKEIPYSFKERMFGHTKRNLFLFILSYTVTIFKLRFGK